MKKCYSVRQLVRQLMWLNVRPGSSHADNKRGQYIIACLADTRAIWPPFDSIRPTWPTSTNCPSAPHCNGGGGQEFRPSLISEHGPHKTSPIHQSNDAEWSGPGSGRPITPNHSNCRGGVKRRRTAFGPGTLLNGNNAIGQMGKWATKTLLNAAIVNP